MLLHFHYEPLSLIVVFFFSAQGTNFSGTSEKYSLVRIVSNLTGDVAGEIDNVEVWHLELFPHFVNEHLILMKIC